MDKHLSLAFFNIRFPLAILVIVLHILPIPHITFNHFNWIDLEQGSWLYYPLLICGVTLARLAVPTFFFMSGYLLYNGCKELTFNIYWNKLKKRINTLIIPYFFWNLLAYLYLIISDQCQELSLFYIFLSPANFPLWFLRDLIIIVLFSPILFIAIKYLKRIGLLTFVIIYIVGINIPNIFIVNISSLFFVYIGMYMAYYNISFSIINKYNSYIYSSTFILYILNIYFYGDVNIAVTRLYLIFVVFASLLFFYNINIKNKYLSILSSSTFFIYVSHKLGPTYISKYPFRYIENNMYTDSIIFIICPLITAGICFTIFLLLKNFNNKYINLLIGIR